MELKFSSFRDIADKKNKLEDYISDHTGYWAHVRKGGEYEQLKQHISLVENYWINLIEVIGLESVIDRCINKIIKCFKEIVNIEEFGEYLKEIFWATMYFHDFGKINNNFQVKKMNNPSFQYDNSISFRTEHSKLSVFLFFNYYLDDIYFNDKTLTRDEKYILIALCIAFANSILKHHSSRINCDIFLDKNFINSALKFKSSLNFKINEDFSYNFLSKPDKVLNLLNNKSIDDCGGYFSLFALIKLSYSLLTASDYYATSEFMSGFKISYFGLIDTKLRKQIIHSFKSNPEKPYNNEIIDKTEEINNIPFKHLEQKNNKNLNILRLKLASLAVSNLRNNPNNNLFYLEAPTGSGKTNTSIALAIELLKQDERLNKIFYVFPFTTLVTQTYKAIKETIDIDDNEIIQLHSKTGMPSANGKEGNYGKDYKNYIDYLFVNYPITVLTHIRFFEVLKGNDKESNYLLHRLANSIVIIDELQSYTPHHWDKIIYFINKLSGLLNIKFILMSATLPKLDELNKDTEGFFINLVPNKEDFFLNPNFKDRVIFEFIDWKQPKNEEEKELFLNDLADFILEKSEGYAFKNDNKVRTVVEFVSKRTASGFLSKYLDKPEFDEYRKYLISGEILDSRRKEILDEIKAQEHDKIIVITTQVIEAGVDIDMDLGFKDKSLIDSEEQLAGRINREATKEGCKLYLFNYDLTKNTYGQDYRYKIQTTDEWIEKNYLNILQKKQFDALYSRVNKRLLAENKDAFNSRSAYWNYFKKLNLSKINSEFKLIDQNNVSVFIPLRIDIKHFNEKDLVDFGLKPDRNNEISGKDVFEIYIALITNDELPFMDKKIDLKKLAAIMAQFTISLFANQFDKIQEYCDEEKSKYGYKYLSSWEKVYSYESGFNMDVIKSDKFI